MPALGPHVPLKSVSIVRPRGTGFISESMLSGAHYLKSVMCHGCVTSGSCRGISNLSFGLLLPEEGLG